MVKHSPSYHYNTHTAILNELKRAYCLHNSCSCFHEDHADVPINTSFYPCIFNVNVDRGIENLINYNTSMYMFQTGLLSIEVPPDFIPEETSGDVTVPEGWHVSIRCIEIRRIRRTHSSCGGRKNSTSISNFYELRFKTRY